MAKAHDGSDFKHRQRILPHYQSMALTKKRLKFTLILHFFLSVLMGLKLLPALLDKFEIFIQPLEELYIPAPKRWEIMWFSGVLSLLVAFRGIQLNEAKNMVAFLCGSVAKSLLPIMYCAYQYYEDFRTYVITKDASKCSEVWLGYPTALYWYIFIGVAAQIHIFEIYFAEELRKAFSIRPRSVTNKNK